MTKDKSIKVDNVVDEQELRTEIEKELRGEIEQVYKRKEINLKIFGLIVTVAAIFIGLIQYFDGQAHENFMELKRSVWEKQLDTYTRACKYAGLIAINPNDKDFEKNVKAFGGLYWGEMIMVEDSIVEKTMNKFYHAIIDYNPEDIKSQNKLKYRANELAKACRQSSLQTWNELKE